MSYDYDDQNIFAKILRGEIPSTTVMETAHTLAFRDIAPQAPDHVLVIPKGAYVTFDHFSESASDAEIVDFNRTVGEICRMLGARPGDGGSGYRLVANSGEVAIQDVQHFHLHILAGRALGPMLPPMG